MGNLKKADVGVKKTTADVAAIALKCSRGLRNTSCTSMTDYQGRKIAR